MKKYHGLLVAVATGMLAVTLCGCGENEAATPIVNTIQVNSTAQAETVEQSESVEQSENDFVGPDEEEFTFDYEGTYEDEASNVVTIRNNNDGTYYIDVSLFRLADFEDEKAYVENQALWFSTVDPAGNNMVGCFHQSAGDTFIVEFSNIDWEYIKSGDYFDGFTR